MNNEEDLLPDNLSPNLFRDPRQDIRDQPATPGSMAMDIVRAGCGTGVETEGGFVSMPASLYEEITKRKPPQSRALRPSEIEILKALAQCPTGLTKDNLAHAIGLDGPHGALGREWIPNLISHGYIVSGGKGSASKGYRITEAGSDVLAICENGAQ